MINEPIKLIPAFKDYLWGGDKLKKYYNKKSDLEILAESWELSTHRDGNSIVENGEFKGLSFSEYIEKNDCIGSRAKKFDFFPVLIKFIDANKSLSIQVHPSDEYALSNENSYGKTEMWYVLDAEPNSYLYYGLNKSVSKEELTCKIKSGEVLSILNKVYVKPGDVFFIESGTIHAIGEGLVICEIQQNSNLTYRVFDFNRKGKDGKLRPLHIEKAIEVSKLTPSLPYKSKDENTLAECKYFTVKRYSVSDFLSINCDKDCFHSVIITSGSGTLTLENSTLQFVKGDSIFIPAQTGEYTINGNCEIIVTYV